MDLIVEEGLKHGAILCAAMTVIVIGSLRHDPMIWVKSGPPDLQALLGPPSKESLRRKKAWGAAMLVVLLGVFGSLAHVVLQLPGASLWDVALAAWIAFQVFNLFDAVVLDVGLVVWKPSWAFLPGTADLPGLRSVKWHLKNWLKGFAGSFAFAALVAGVTWALLQISGH
jgi:hypothetical protein